MEVQFGFAPEREGCLLSLASDDVEFLEHLLRRADSFLYLSRLHPFPMFHDAVSPVSAGALRLPPRAGRLTEPITPPSGAASPIAGAHRRLSWARCLTESTPCPLAQLLRRSGALRPLSQGRCLTESTPSPLDTAVPSCVMARQRSRTPSASSTFLATVRRRGTAAFSLPCSTARQRPRTPSALSTFLAIASKSFRRPLRRDGGFITVVHIGAGDIPCDSVSSLWVLFRR